MAEMLKATLEEEKTSLLESAIRSLVMEGTLADVSREALRSAETRRIIKALKGNKKQ